MTTRFWTTAMKKRPHAELIHASIVKGLLPDDHARQALLVGLGSLDQLDHLLGDVSLAEQQEPQACCPGAFLGPANR